MVNIEISTELIRLTYHAFGGHAFRGHAFRSHASRAHAFVTYHAFSTTINRVSHFNE